MREIDETQRRKHLYGLQTNAVVLHCPGPLRSPSNPMHLEWERAQATFFADGLLKGAFRDDPELTIITYNSTPDAALLERCAEYLGFGVVVLGRELKDWNWEYKITLVRDYLRSGLSSRYVMCLDAFDTLILSSPETIVERFRQVSTGMLFAGTATDWPPSLRHRAFESRVASDVSPEHRHLNASFIGETADIVECLNDIVSAIDSGASWARTDSGFDDQLAWREIHYRRHPRLVIDSRCTIFARFDKFR